MNTGDARGRCGAECRDGRPCQAWPVRFSTRCRMHGGASPRSREAAARREVEARAEVMLAKLDVEPVTDPGAALLRVSAETLALKSWLADRFNEADAASQWMLAELFGRALERASKLLVEIHRLGLDERQAALTRLQAELIADAVGGMLHDFGVDRSRSDFGAIVRRHLERAGRLDSR